MAATMEPRQQPFATGTCPGYFKPGVDPVLDAKVKLLASFLKDNLAAQNPIQPDLVLMGRIGHQ